MIKNKVSLANLLKHVKATKHCNALFFFNRDREVGEARGPGAATMETSRMPSGAVDHPVYSSS